MKFVWLIACLLVTGLISTPAQAAEHKPTSDAYITSFSANDPNGSRYDEADGPGPLTIGYSDGTKVTVANERGEVAEGKDIIPQADFSELKLSETKKVLGWLAEYQICAQSYPCPIELIIHRVGEKSCKINPGEGVFWDWAFTNHGSQVVTASGMPHGSDNEISELYDVATCKKLGSYDPMEQESGTLPPDWAK